MRCGNAAAVAAFNRGSTLNPRQLAEKSVDGCASSRAEMMVTARSSAQSLAPGRNVNRHVGAIVAYERQQIIEGLARTIQMTADRIMR